jgi:hypothetical protein
MWKKNMENIQKRHATNSSIREAVDHLSTPLFQTINHMVSNHLGDRGALEVGCFLDIYRYLRYIGMFTC